MCCFNPRYSMSQNMYLYLIYMSVFFNILAQTTCLSVRYCIIVCHINQTFVVFMFHSVWIVMCLYLVSSSNSP